MFNDYEASIDTIWVCSQNLIINDADGKPLLISVPTMPSYLRQGVLDSLAAIFECTMPLKRVDSEIERDSGVYHVLHLDYYNQFSEQVSTYSPI